MKYKSAMLWNYMSLVIMAASGLLMNLIIIYFYDSVILGIFNETYAWYLICSQVTVLGMHMCVLRFVPECREIEEKGSILKTSLFITLIISTILVILIEGILFALKDVAWSRSLQIAVLGLSFFSLNKVLLNYLNAIYEMVAYAIFQSIRYIVIVIALFFMAFSDINGRNLAWVFPITEALIFVCLYIYICRYMDFIGRIEKERITGLMSFGIRIVPSNMIMETNTKVDVVCLGLMGRNQAEIGVYSFAILFTEGFYMLYITARRVINPKLAEMNAIGMLKRQVEYVEQMLQKYLVIISLSVYSIMLVVYALAAMYIGKQEYKVGLLFIAVIGTAIVINGKKIILGDILAQAGYPLEESKLNILTIMSNVILNVLLILLFGTIGAAAATGISHFVYSIYLKRTVRNRIGIEI